VCSDLFLAELETAVVIEVRAHLGMYCCHLLSWAWTACTAQWENSKSWPFLYIVAGHGQQLHSQTCCVACVHKLENLSMNVVCISNKGSVIIAANWTHCISLIEVVRCICNYFLLNSDCTVQAWQVPFWWCVSVGVSLNTIQKCTEKHMPRYQSGVFCESEHVILLWNLDSWFMCFDFWF
jgi:hypothetical protein